MHIYTSIRVHRHTGKGGVTLIKVGINVNSTILIFLSSPLEHLQRPGNIVGGPIWITYTIL